MASAWLQYVLVGVVVLVAASYAAVKYVPKSLRRRLIYKLSNGSSGSSGSAKGNVRGRLVQWLDADAGCGSGCDTCGSCETTPMPEQDAQGRKVIQLHVER